MCAIADAVIVDLIRPLNGLNAIRNLRNERLLTCQRYIGGIEVADHQNIGSQPVGKIRLAPGRQIFPGRDVSLPETPDTDTGKPDDVQGIRNRLNIPVIVLAEVNIDAKRVQEILRLDVPVGHAAPLRP